MDAIEEEFVPEEEAQSGPAALKSLRERLKKAVAEKQEYLEGWQRARADLVNYKKETADGHGESRERIKSALIEELLPALDVLELSVRHDGTPALKMLEKQFLDGLKKLGIERYGEVGEAFDPRKHEALAMKGDDHVVQSVERSGYKTGEKIIRPAQVII
jgi:molecular chaperone GrpE